MNTSRHGPRWARLLAAAAVIAAPLALPTPSAARPLQDEPSDPTGGSELTSPLSTDDVLRATSGDVVTSLEDLAAEVQAQVEAVTAARNAEAAANADLEAADAAVAETQAVLDEMTDRSDVVVVEAFINPPSEDALETLSADTLTDATIQQSILDNNSDANADVLTELQAATDDVAAVKAAQDEAAAAAEERAEEATQALAELVASQSAETLFVLAVQDRLDATLAEADALADVDPDAAAAIRAREGEIAATLAGITAAREEREAQAALAQAMEEAAAAAAEEAASRPSGSATLGPASGSLSSVPCPGGGSITVDDSLAGNLQSLLDDAAADGNNLCGGGYRDPEAQIALRRSNCGSSSYAIYEAPSSSCSPPTAPPGSSNHEQGLAIDFTCNGGGALGSSSPCFAWLKANAASHGLYNLPSEPWHWSNDGT